MSQHRTASFPHPRLSPLALRVIFFHLTQPTATLSESPALQSRWLIPLPRKIVSPPLPRLSLSLAQSLKPTPFT